MKKYQVTKAQCQKEIDKISDGVCPGCGGLVTPLETVNNADEPTYWSGCEDCSVFTYPVSIKIFSTAQNLIDDGEYVYNSKPWKATEGELDYWHRNESRAVCGKLQKYLRHWKSS